MNSKEIHILRGKFFDECTDRGLDGLTEINCAPHDLFEWFKKQALQPKEGVSDDEIYMQAKELIFKERVKVFIDGSVWMRNHLTKVKHDKQ